MIGIGSASLLAHDLVFQDLLSEGLPDNQWQLEASNFFAISLARLQASVLEFSAKSSQVAEDQYLVAASTEQEQYLCNNQKIRDIGGYELFTAAAVWLIIIVGLIILILGATIDSVRCGRSQSAYTGNIINSCSGKQTTNSSSSGSPCMSSVNGS